jgi:hypothetical protein
MAEALSFNQTLGFVGQDPLSPRMLQYIDFYRKNRDLFVGTRDVASVALLRSYPSIAYHNARAQLSAILMEQVLIQSRIPFDLIFDEQMVDLSKYKVVLLPNSECLSDRQIGALERFVQGGGGLVATEQAGLYDEWHRVRLESGLSRMVKTQPQAEAYQEQVVSMEMKPVPPLRNEYGKGRAVYVPALVFDGPLPEWEPYYNIGSRYWKRPRNWKEIEEGILRAAGGKMPVEISGPPFLVANPVSQPDKRRMILHLVNYDAVKGKPVEGIDVTCELQAGGEVKEVRLLSPDWMGPQSLKASGTGSTVAFRVPEVKTYVLAVVSW